MPKDFDDFLKTLTPELIKDISIRVSSNVNDSLFEILFPMKKTPKSSLHHFLVL